MFLAKKFKNPRQGTTQASAQQVPQRIISLYGLPIQVQAMLRKQDK